MRKFRLRIMSGLLVAVMLVTLLPDAISGSSAYAEEPFEEAEPTEPSDQSGEGGPMLLAEAGDYEALLATGRYTVTDGGAVRGVVDGLDELNKLEYDLGEELGSPKHPFLVLEIVPYMEYSEFGYLIGGCEPVDIDLVSDADFKALAQLGIFENGYSNTDTAYFFADEPEYQKYADFLEGSSTYNENISRVTNSSGNSVSGYYYYKGPGAGHYSLTGLRDRLDELAAAASGNSLDMQEDMNLEEVNDVEALEEIEGEISGIAGYTESMKPAAKDNESSEESNKSSEESNKSSEESNKSPEEGSENPVEDNENPEEVIPGVDESTITQEQEEAAPSVDESTITQEQEEAAPSVDESTITQKQEAEDLEVSAKTARQDTGTFFEGTSLPTKGDQFVLLAGSTDNGDGGDDDGNTNDDGDGGDDDGKTNDNGDGGDNSNTNGGTEQQNNTGKDALEKDKATVAAPNSDGSGIMLTADGQIVIYSAKGGEGFDWEWHSLTAAEKAEYESSGHTFHNLNELGKSTDLETVNALLAAYDSAVNNGEVAIYALRDVGDVDGYDVNMGYIQVNNYPTYKNSELFVKESLGLLSQKEVDEYSVVVKTITPVDLNKEYEKWFECANLIYLSTRKSYSGSSDPEYNLFKIWQNCGWPKKPDYQPLNEIGSEYRKSQYDSDADKYAPSGKLDWNTVYALYNKVTADKNYAGLIMDDDIYIDLEGKNMYTNSYTEGAQNPTINVYDWNMDTIGISDKGRGINNNLYKLAVMLFSMDPSLFKKLYLEPINGNEDPLIDKSTGNINGSWQEGDASTRWSVETFLLMNPYISGDEYEKWIEDGDYWWDNYHSVVDPTYEFNEYDYYANDHVFVWKDGNSIVGDYSNLITLSDGYKTKFPDFISHLGEAAPTPAKAVGYILRDVTEEPGDQQGSEDIRNIKVLDLEPFVEVALEGDSSKYSPKEWPLRTESYISMLLPFYRVDIDQIDYISDYVSHQTLAEFNGKFEDLISEYDLIYLGGNFPDGVTDRDSYNYLISQKEEDLEEFLGAGHIIIAENCYFKMNDSSDKVELSDDWSALNSYYSPGQDDKKTLFSIRQVGEASRAVGEAGSAVSEIPENPDINVTSPEVYSETSTSFLPRNDASGEVSVQFKFDIIDTGDGDTYYYDIYVDRDGDLRFADGSKNYNGYSEIIYSNSSGITISSKESVSVSPSPVIYLDRAGLVNWKIEVYNGNRTKRKVKTGSSLVKNTTDEEINILEITDKTGDTVLSQALKTYPAASGWGNYIIPDPVPMSLGGNGGFNAIFARKDFKYYYDEEEKRQIGPSGLEDLDVDLMKYDMIIVDVEDISKMEPSAKQFLKYWEDLGRSIVYLNGQTLEAESMYEGTGGSLSEGESISMVTQLNQGLSLYPYPLAEGIEVAEKVAVKPLSEDGLEKMTVWYCLAGEDYNWNDAKNSCYIYSNKNAFYSYIGYKATGAIGESELQLFINMLIAAYNSSDDGPVIKIEDLDAIQGSNLTYEIKGLVRNYGWDEPQGEAMQVAETGDEAYYGPVGEIIVGSNPYYKIKFSLDGLLGMLDDGTEKLECKIQYYDKDKGQFSNVKLEEFSAEDPPSNGTYTLERGKSYTLLYPKKNLDPDGSGNIFSRIKFEIVDSHLSYDLTLPAVVHMSELPLFPLD